MPWYTYKWDNPENKHAQMKEKYNIVGVPNVYVLDAPSGFLITKKGRKDICDLGVNCMKNWVDEMKDMIVKQEHLANGAAIVKEAKLQAEAEEARKRAAEKENE